MKSNQKEVDSFLRELNDGFSTQDKQIFDLYNQKEEKCFQSAKGNPDKFAECMAPSIKRREDEETRLCYQTEFLVQQLDACLTESKGDSGKIAKCKEITRKDFGTQLETYIKRLSKD